MYLPLDLVLSAVMIEILFPSFYTERRVLLIHVLNLPIIWSIDPYETPSPTSLIFGIVLILPSSLCMESCPCGFLMEASLHSYDWHYQWPVATDSTSSAPPILGGQQVGQQVPAPEHHVGSPIPTLEQYKCFQKLRMGPNMIPIALIAQEIPRVWGAASQKPWLKTKLTYFL